MSTRLHTRDTSSLSLILPIMVIAPVDLSMLFESKIPWAPWTQHLKKKGLKQGCVDHFF